MILVISKIYGYNVTKKNFLIANLFLLMLLLFSTFAFNEAMFFVIWFISQILQIVLIAASYHQIKLFSVISIYVFLYGINSILIIALNNLLSLPFTNMALVELGTNIITTSCCIYCCLNKRISLHANKIVSTIPIKIKFITLFAICVSAWLMIVILSNPEMYGDSYWSISVRIALIFFSLFICTTFPILIITVLTNTYLKKQNESFERELEAQAEHYVALAEANKELSRFKHDFKNLRIGIKKALTAGDCEIALEMIENGQNDFIQATDNIVKYNTGNGIVDAILSEKQKKATASNTIITFQGIIPQTGFSPTDLCVIFGNTLDNAIEACEKISIDTEKVINVSVNCTGGFVFISITNPVAEKVIVHNNHIETTKKDRTSHGFGLYSLQKIAKKYDGEMSIISEEHTFTLTLELCL